MKIRIINLIKVQVKIKQQMLKKLFYHMQRVVYCIQKNKFNKTVLLIIKEQKIFFFFYLIQ